MAEAAQTKDKDAQTKRRYHHGDLRTVLLAAAEAELEAVGIERFSLRAVAKRAEVSHAAPAHHFKDAVGLLTAMATLGYQRLCDMLKETGDAVADPIRRIDGAGVGYVRFAMERPALFRLMFSSSRPNFDDPELKAASDAAYAILAKDIEVLCGQNPFVLGTAMSELTIAWGLVHGIADLLNAGRMTHLLAKPAIERDQIVQELMHRAVQSQH